MRVAVALLLCRAVRSGLAVNGSLTVGSRAVGVMVIGLLNNHGRRRRSRCRLAAAEYQHGCGGE
jgi:hypothetical protein